MTYCSVPQSLPFTPHIHFSNFTPLVHCALFGFFAFYRHLLLTFIISVPPTEPVVVVWVLQVAHREAPLPRLGIIMLVLIPLSIIFGGLVPIPPFIFRVGLVLLLAILIVVLVRSLAFVLSLSCGSISWGLSLLQPKNSSYSETQQSTAG